MEQFEVQIGEKDSEKYANILKDQKNSSQKQTNKNELDNQKNSIILDQDTREIIKTNIKEKTQRQKLREFYQYHRSAIELWTAFALVFMVPIYLAPIIFKSSDQIETIFTITIPLGFFLGVAIGGNDICNSMGTSYGSKTLTMTQAVLLGIFFEVLGVLTMGEHVAKTIGYSILNVSEFENKDGGIIEFSLCMTAILAAGAFSCLAVTIYGIPVSITQGIVFGMAAVGIASVGSKAVLPNTIYKITIALISSPVVGVLISLIVYTIIIKIIKQNKDPYKQALLYLPLFGFVNIFVISYIVAYKGLQIKQVWLCVVLSIGSGLLISLYLFIYSKNKKSSQQALYEEMIKQNQLELMSEKIFKPLLIISACCVAFTHGSNDVANNVGPLVAVYSIYKGQNDLDAEISVPFWSLVLGAVSFTVGISTLGQRTIKALGQGITSLDPMKSFTIQMSTAIAILLSTFFSMPVSTSHCTVGSILGVTLAEKLNGRNYLFKKGSLKKIFASWIYTIPLVFLLAIYFFYALLGVIST